MNESPRISVIVPVYNAEKYLTQCVESILKQDFTDFELLLVDDGSKDNSSLICDEYAQKDQRVKVFHKENGGVSSARNVGLDKAQGEYIAFIDSDDYVDSNYFSILMGATADLIITGYKTLGYARESGFGSMKKEHSFQDYLCDEHQIPVCLASMLDDTSMRSPWIKLFKHNIIKERVIRFDQTLRMGEDAVFLQNYLLYCHSIAFRNGTPYHYRVISNEDSCFKYSLSSNEYLYTLCMALEVYKQLSQHFHFTCQDYYNTTTKLMLLLYYRHITKEHFSFNKYINYKNTIKQQCPKVRFSDKLYILSYNLSQKKMFFLSYLILTLIYPLKLYFINSKKKW